MREAANDNVHPNDGVQYEGTWLRASQIAAFIEWDLKFGNPQPEYPTSDDVAPPREGRLFLFHDQRGRRLWAAYIPLQCDDDCATRWSVEVYRRKRNAQAAIDSEAA